MLIADFINRDAPVDVKEAVLAQWRENSAPLSLRPCPFLLAESCAVYPVRPIACRRFLISGAKCSPGEDPTRSRPGALIVPASASRDEALELLYAWHGARWRELGLPKPPPLTGKLDWLAGITTVAQAIDWEKVLTGK